jgi:two-component system, NarL family, response regulator DesR
MSDRLLSFLESQSMINILVVEDSPVFASALVLVLQGQMKEELNLVKVVNSAEDALQAVVDLPIDMVLVDNSLPQMSGIELVQILQQRCPELPCLIVTGELSSLSMRRSLKAGARGYLIKDHASSIGKAIRLVLGGGFYISPELQTSLPAPRAT